MSARDIEVNFPTLLNSGYNITSPGTIEYNCIAWAASENDAWWWLDLSYNYYWPPEIIRECTIDSFIQAYGLLGYSVCENGNFEDGFEKIVIYVDVNSKPTHAARQLENHHWTSKLGAMEDIEHYTVEGISGSTYGSPAIFMRRARQIKTFSLK